MSIVLSKEWCFIRRFPFFSKNFLRIDGLEILNKFVDILISILFLRITIVSVKRLEKWRSDKEIKSKLVTLNYLCFSTSLKCYTHAFNSICWEIDFQFGCKIEWKSKKKAKFVIKSIKAALEKLSTKYLKRLRMLLYHEDIVTSSYISHL